LSTAEKLRTGIGGRHLPDDDEWLDYRRYNEEASDLNPPALLNRKVTVSVGVSTVCSPRDTVQPAALANQLKGEADIALYKAKNLGRDQVVYFPDIIARHGRVLEHHKDTGVITINLGSQVGVRPGNEFLVFHPQFDGKRCSAAL
jgi:hypothetical protein